MRFKRDFQTLFAGSLLIAGLFLGVGSCSETPSEASLDFADFARDGTWSRLADPRAIYYEGLHRRVYAGWKTSLGEVQIGALDEDSGEITTTTVHRDFDHGDSGSPTLLLLQDGRIGVFYSGDGNTALYYRMTEAPEDIGTFGAEQKVNADAPAKSGKYADPNPIRLAAENGRIHLFWRGDSGEITFATSNDGGATFDTGRQMTASKSQMPYFKIYSNGESRIHFAFIDSDPWLPAGNEVHYAAYSDGMLVRADGTPIKGFDQLPFEVHDAETVYDASSTGSRAWVWDVAADVEDRPIIVYTRMLQKSEHRYHYARWNGAAWQDHEMAAAGGWLPEMPNESDQPNSYYAGGAVIDHQNPSVVYISRPIGGTFEIERWTTRDEGHSWATEALTSSSREDNVRPVDIRGQLPNASPTILWMKHDPASHYLKNEARIAMDIRDHLMSPEFDKRNILKAMSRVASFQLAHLPPARPKDDWTYGALFAGLSALAKASSDPSHLELIRETGENLGWALGPRLYNADDHCIGQGYLALHQREHVAEMIQPMRERFDWILANQSNVSLERGYDWSEDRWSWVDSLFMAPPTWAQLWTATGDRKYLDFMNKEWWTTVDYLFDSEERLLFQSNVYFDQHEVNGRKVFWSRGNGWAFAGLVRVIDELPPDYPDRPKYIQLYMQMAERLVELQPKDGLWRASLLDPGGFPAPETSGTAFFVYGLAWGIRNGLLEETVYLPPVQRAWAGLTRAIFPDGKLGWVQLPAAEAAPVRPEHVELYGVGAFLLAGAEVHALAPSKE